MRWVGGLEGALPRFHFLRHSAYWIRSSQPIAAEAELAEEREKGAGLAGLAGWLAGCWFSAPRTALSSSPALQAGRRRCSTATPTVAVRRRIQPLLTPPVSTPPLVQVLRPRLRTRTEQNCSASAPPCLGCCFFMFCFFPALPS